MFHLQHKKTKNNRKTQEYILGKRINYKATKSNNPLKNIIKNYEKCANSMEEFINFDAIYLTAFIPMQLCCCHAGY